MRRHGGEVGPNGTMRHIFRAVRARGNIYKQLYAYKMLPTRFLGGVHGEMANIFDFCSSEGGTHWWKWCGDGSMYDIGCGGGLFDIILERGDSFQGIQNAITEVLGGCLKKWRTCLTSAAARVVHTGGNGVEMVACMILGVGGGCLITFWKEGTPSYSKCYRRGFGWDIW